MVQLVQLVQLVQVVQVVQLVQLVQLVQTMRVRPHWSRSFGPVGLLLADAAHVVGVLAGYVSKVPWLAAWPEAPVRGALPLYRMRFTPRGHTTLRTPYVSPSRHLHGLALRKVVDR